MCLHTSNKIGTPKLKYNAIYNLLKKKEKEININLTKHAQDSML